MKSLGIAMLVLSSILVACPSMAEAQRAAANGHSGATLAIRAVRVDTRPTIDGRIDEPVWAAADVATGFVQTQPRAGRPATQRTEVRILYDDEALYVAARMHDTTPDSIVAQLARRDSEIHSDWFYVAIDSYFDRRTAFVFGLNPVGVKVDALLHNDTEGDVSWDAVWEGAATLDEDGWSAEFRIPLSQLRFGTPQQGREQLWGVNFLRKIARAGEESWWAPIPPDGARVVSLFGELRGLRDLRPPRRLEVTPYVVGRATRAPGVDDDPFHRSTHPFGSAGADVKAGLTSDLTLTATFNPDFGQVEADPSVVNLTPSEIFFSERRPFFVEGIDIFRFGIGLGDGELGNESLFYSRRIGRPPQGRVEGEYTTAPDHTTILAAVKLSGKTTGGWSVGLLDAVTAAQHGRYRADDQEGETPVEPLTNYAVARVIRDFRDGNSAVGGIVTATNRRLPESGELDWLRRSAYTGGIDVRHQFGGNAYRVSASLTGSRVAGAPEAIDRVQRSPVHYFQRPDADHLGYDPERTVLAGFAAKADLFKLEGNLRFAGFLLTSSPGFEANDLGFQNTSDLALAGGWVGYQQYEPGRILRSWSVNTNVLAGATYGGEPLVLTGNINGPFQFNNFWGGTLALAAEGPVLSASMLRGGPAFLKPAAWHVLSNLYTDERRPISLGTTFRMSGEPEAGTRSFRAESNLNIRPAHHMDVSLGTSYANIRSDVQYVATRQVPSRTHWVLGALDQTTVAMTARLNYALSPDVSVQFYAQPFVSTGWYSDFKLVADARAPRLSDRTHTLGPDEISATADDDGRIRHHVDLDGDGATDFSFDDPAFSFRQLRSNLVLRWEYRPGSTLFLVWSQGRTDIDRNGRFRFADDVDALRHADSTNVLLVKASYWFGL